MIQQEIDWEIVLDALRRQHARLGAEIAKLERLHGPGSPTPMVIAAVPAVPCESPHGAEALPIHPPAGLVIEPHEYRGLKCWEAARQYIRAVGAPQTMRAIVEALRLGGYETAAKKFNSNVFTSLKNRPDIFRRVGAGVWTLLEFMDDRA